MEQVTEPGNDGFTLGACYVEPAAANLKEELVNQPDVGREQYDLQLAKSKVHLASDECRKLRCEEANWEEKYGLKRGAFITIEYLLALQIYCVFSETCSAFTATFWQQKGETFASLKKRHGKFALMAKNLREFVEGFGTKLCKGARGVPTMFYRGISKKFLFEKTILRFNGPMSTTVNRSIAVEFANMGHVLTLQPHWKGFRGNIRALDCSTFSDFSHESEWLFIGGLEPLLIHDIRDLSSGVSYRKELQTINNVHQIMDGVVCIEEVNKKTMARLIDNRLRDDDDEKRDTSYMCTIFDCYCNGIEEVKIRLSLMSVSYKKVSSLFMDKWGVLKLEKIARLFPRLKRLTVVDGFDHQLVPADTYYERTILGASEECLRFVAKANHQLQSIRLEANAAIKEVFLQKYQQRIKELGWECKPLRKGHVSEDHEHHYKIHVIV